MSDNALVVTNYDKIRALARSNSTIERFISILGNRQWAQSYVNSALLVVANSDKLQQCTPSSVLNAVARAATLQLDCDPATKQAHIVPFYNNKTGKQEAQLIPGYVGLKQMAHRTGKYRVLHTDAIYEGQTIERDQLTGIAKINGLPKSRTPIAYFNYFELYSGFSHFFSMTVEELRAHGKRYAPKNPMWQSDFDAMCRKTVTRLHLLKDGVLQSRDRAMLAEMNDEQADSEMLPTVDAVFLPVDDELAEVEALRMREEEAEQPKKSEDEIMGELFGETKPAAQTAKPAAPAPVEQGETNTTTVPAEWPVKTLQKYVVMYKMSGNNEVRNILNLSNLTPAAPTERVDAWVKAYRELRAEKDEQGNAIYTPQEAAAKVNETFKQ